MGGGGSQKVTSDDEGEGGVMIPPKNDDVIYEQPLTHFMMISTILSLYCSTVCLDIFKAHTSHEGRTFQRMTSLTKF